MEVKLPDGGVGEELDATSSSQDTSSDESVENLASTSSNESVDLETSEPTLPTSTDTSDLTPCTSSVSTPADSFPKRNWRLRKRQRAPSSHVAQITPLQVAILDRLQTVSQAISSALGKRSLADKFGAYAAGLLEQIPDGKRRRNAEQAVLTILYDAINEEI